MQLTPAFALALLALVGLASCGGSDEPSEPQEGVEDVSQLLVEYYEAAEGPDLGAMYLLIDPELRAEVPRSDWSGCISQRLAPFDGASFSYEHTTDYEEDGRTFVEGVVTVELDGASQEAPGVVEVVNRDGRWFAVRSLSGSEPDCVDVARSGE